MVRGSVLETCGLMVVTQVIVPAAVSFPAAVNNVDELQSALESQAGAGAEVSITSVKTTLTSGFTLPVRITESAPRLIAVPLSVLLTV